MTLIQRFGSALNLNIHFHMLFLDGVYVDDASEESHQRFVPVTRHRVADMLNLTHKISLRIARYLERTGLIERDAENSYLAAGDVAKVIACIDAVVINKILTHLQVSQSNQIMLSVSRAPPVAGFTH